MLETARAEVYTAHARIAGAYPHLIVRPEKNGMYRVAYQLRGRGLGGVVHIEPRGAAHRVVYAHAVTVGAYPQPPRRVFGNAVHLLYTAAVHIRQRQRHRPESTRGGIVAREAVEIVPGPYSAVLAPEAGYDM